MNHYLNVLKKYAVFSGRAQRAEYWYFVLFNAIIATVLSFFGKVGTLATFIYLLAIIIPGIAVSVRRFHDTNRSGWWLLINFVPVIGAIVFLVFTVLDSDPNSNQYGPNPKSTMATMATV
ncbi:MAG: DUF805 domain-containing protein [Minisyncoccota bacterium]